MSVAQDDIGEIVRVCEDNCINHIDESQSKIIKKIMWDRLKNTKSNPWSINKLTEAYTCGCTNVKSETELEDAISITIKTMDGNNNEIELATELVIAYSNYSTNDRSPADLEIATLGTLNTLGADCTWQDIDDTIRLITKYSEKSKKGKSVLELKDATCKTLEYAHQKGLNLKTIIDNTIDNVYKSEIQSAKDKYHLKIDEIKANNTGLVKTIKLLKEKITFELHQYQPVFSAQELCDKIINSNDRVYSG